MDVHAVVRHEVLACGGTATLAISQRYIWKYTNKYMVKMLLALFVRQQYPKPCGTKISEDLFEIYIQK